MAADAYPADIKSKQPPMAFGGNDDYAASTPPADLLFASTLGFVHALRKRDGASVWDTPLRGAGWKPTSLLPHPPSDTLLAAAGANLRALDARDGKQRWENRLEGIGYGYASLTMEPSSAVPTAAADADAADGGASDPGRPTPGASRSLADVVYVALNSIVRAVRASDGADLWEFRVPFMESVSPVPSLLIEDGVLFVSGNGRVVAVDALKGQKIWAADTKHRGLSILATMRSSPMVRPLAFDPTAELSSPRPRIPSDTKPTLLQSSLLFGASGYLGARPKHEEPPQPQSADPAAPLPDRQPLSIKGSGYFPVSVVPLPDSGDVVVASGANLRRYHLDSGDLCWENKLTGIGIGNPAILIGCGLPPSALDLPPEEDAACLPSYSATAEKTGVAGPSSISTGSNSSTDSLAKTPHPRDRVFLSVNGNVQCVRVSDGCTLWKFRPGILGHIKLGRLLADSDSHLFLAGGLTGRIRCLSADTGVE
ncbi:hypothetical protein HK405_015676, partial [Cladochytrium tenue]